MYLSITLSSSFVSFFELGSQLPRGGRPFSRYPSVVRDASYTFAASRYVIFASRLVAWTAKVSLASFKDCTRCNGSGIAVVVEVVQFLAKVARSVVWPARW